MLRARFAYIYKYIYEYVYENVHARCAFVVYEKIFALFIDFFRIFTHYDAFTLLWRIKWSNIYPKFEIIITAILDNLIRIKITCERCQIHSSRVDFFFYLIT